MEKYLLKCKCCGFSTEWSTDLGNITIKANKHLEKYPDHEMELKTLIRKTEVYARNKLETL
jgi:hypothetical protein